MSNADGRPDHDGPTRVRVRVPAKINPFLAVRGVRDDGYHELTTVFSTVAVHDVLTLRLTAEAGRLNHPTSNRRMALRLTHDAGPNVPTDGSNLISRAAAVLAAELGMSLTDGAAVCTEIELTKRIPIAGGMAGGSADAAAALRGLVELWGSDIDTRRLTELAADLGADVPFCVRGGTAIATGTGADVTPVLARGTFHWVVCTRADELSTPAVYAAWDDICEPGEVSPDAVLTALATGDADALGEALHNDLQPAAEHLLPALVGDRAALLDAGALGAMVSGSGPTLLALSRDAEDAQRIAGRVAGRFAQVLVTIAPAGGPVVEVG